MRRPVSTSSLAALLAGLASSAAFGSAVVACGEDDAARARFGVPDAAVDASSSDGGTTADAAVDADAAPQRPPFDPTDEPVVCASTGPCVKQIVAGRYHFCALVSDGTVRCWGDDEYGALGGGEPSKDDPDAGAPVRTVSGIGNATQISAARSTTCARLADGAVRCWGSNSQGQLGLEDLKPSWDELRHPTPSPAAIREPATRVDVGPMDVCAVLATGKVSCWGNNEQAQLAREDLVYVLGPAQAEIDPLAIGRLALGRSTALALTPGGDVWSWGAVAGAEGLVGGRMSSVSPDRLPNKLAGLANVTSLVVSDTVEAGEGGPLLGIGPFPPPPPRKHGHACAIASGELFCWGRSDVGALCTGLPDEEPLPASAPVMGLAWPQQLAVGDEITCARMTNGAVQCCGANGKGRLGAGQTDPFSSHLTPVGSFTGHAVQVAASHRSVCALVKDGSVECWGSNAHRELGTSVPDESPHPSPVKIVF